MSHVGAPVPHPFPSSLSSSESLWEVAESLISIVYVRREKGHEGVGGRKEREEEEMEEGVKEEEDFGRRWVVVS